MRGIQSANTARGRRGGGWRSRNHERWVRISYEQSIATTANLHQHNHLQYNHHSIRLMDSADAVNGKWRTFASRKRSSRPTRWRCRLCRRSYLEEWASGRWEDKRTGMEVTHMRAYEDHMSTHSGAGARIAHTHTRTRACTRERTNTHTQSDTHLPSARFSCRDNSIKMTVLAFLVQRRPRDIQPTHGYRMKRT